MEVSVIDDPPMIDATKCTSAQLRGVGTFLTHGGLIIAQGDNQYIGHPIVLRQLDAKQKQGAKNGVFLAAVCHPEPQNGTFPAAGNEAEWLYRRRLSASHRSPPPADSVFRHYGALADSPWNLSAECPAGVTSVFQKRSWWLSIYDYLMWLAGGASKVAVEGSTGMLLGLVLIARTTFPAPIITRTVIGWFLWNASFSKHRFKQ